MKLSHVLIAALVTTSLVASAQNDKPKKEKHKTKTEKKHKEKAKSINQTPVVETLSSNSSHEKICLACGRG